MSVLKFLNPGKHKLSLLSREEVEKLDRKVPGTNTNSNRTVTEAKKRAKTTVKVKEDTRAANRRISKLLADEATARMAARRERLLKGIQEHPVSLQQSDAYASSHGEIKDDAFLDKAMSWYGLSNGLGLTTNISDRWRATPSFANFVGRSTPEAMAMAGSLVANPVRTVLGMGTGHLGSQAGGYIGELLGNREAGEMVGSLVGMPFGYKVGTTLHGTVPNYYRNYTLARAINQGVRETPIQSTFEPVVRTKVGDVEIDNPELYYHQSGAGKALHFMETGRMRTPTEEYWLAKEAAGEHIPVQLRTGIKPGYPQVPGRAMFSQGSLWYGFDPRGNPDLLVTAKEMPIANRKAGIMSDKASLKKLESQGSRRVTDDNIYGLGPHNTQNTSAYTWEPGYGYRQVSEQPPTYNHPGAFLRNTVRENGGITVNGEGVLRKPYQTPNTRRISGITKEPLMSTDKIVVPVRDRTGKSGFTPIMESDIPTYMELLDSGKATEMVNPRTGQVTRIYKVGNKLPIREDELRTILDKYRPLLTDEQFNNPVLTEEAKTELATANRLHKKISKKYSEALEEIKNKFGINWDWYNGGILASLNIPTKVATSPVWDPRFGKVVDSRPIMLRFYENVTNPDGIIQHTMKEMIDKGILSLTDFGWIMKDSKGTWLVDPSRAVLNYILENHTINGLKSTNRINFRRFPDDLTSSFIPFHSTPLGDKTVTMRFATPTANRELFTSILNSKPGGTALRKAYKKTKFGTSLPMMRKIKLYEHPEEPILISTNGRNSSNAYGDIGELKKHFLGNGGYAQEVIDVSDARNIPGNTGQPLDEYNYGLGTPGVASLLNTYDFEYPAEVVGAFLGFKKGGKFNKN